MYGIGAVLLILLVTTCSTATELGLGGNCRDLNKQIMNW